MTAASRSLATALWGARFASGSLPQSYTTNRDTTRFSTDAPLTRVNGARRGRSRGASGGPHSWADAQRRVRSARSRWRTTAMALPAFARPLPHVPGAGKISQ